jgi:hypothetical protein
LDTQAELQTTSQRVTLSDSSTAPVPVAPSESIDSVISHEVKELGKHTCVALKLNARRPLAVDSMNH